MDWNPRQVAAIAKLESALRAAQQAGIAICGMDDSLIAYSARDLDALEKERGLYGAQQVLCNEREESTALHHYGAYRDSGGW